MDYLNQFIANAEMTANVDILEYVAKMRKQRVFMVQNQVRHISVHDTGTDNICKIMQIIGSIYLSFDL